MFSLAKRPAKAEQRLPRIGGLKLGSWPWARRLFGHIKWRYEVGPNRDHDASASAYAKQLLIESCRLINNFQKQSDQDPSILNFFLEVFGRKFSETS